MQALVDSRHIFLAPAHAVECLGDDQIEPSVARIRKQGLHAGAPLYRPAADRGIRVGLDDCSAVALDPLPAYPHLVLDGGGRLQVCRVAGMDGGTHGGSPVGVRRPGSPARARTRVARRGADVAAFTTGRRLPGAHTDRAARRGA